MSLNQVDRSVRPYYDTFDKTKGFHQVLFTPGRAVQTREVNELQSILQNQIAQFGNNIFENGTKVKDAYSGATMPVIDGKVSLTNNYQIVLLEKN